ncbi:MAG: UDP-N-acetylmuramoyl-L-alanine--D-glutamate ligase [Candidatus Vogelbacteria bacterium]|nr:UDP-N-acetylmuramoyl-L-alanine--D-glutamate ligase [Candidatus Vogelbacteria bacterium]
MDKRFGGKKFTIMGMDANGRGLKDARFLLQHGALVLGTDLKKAEELPEAIALVKEFPDLTLVLGEHRLEDFKNQDYIMRAALAPINSPYLALARDNGIPVVSDETLFLRMAPGIRTIGITGTRGKTTVTYMIYEILKSSSSDSVKQSVFLGGNVQGTAMLPLLDIVKDGDTVVMELDSWKLQSFAENNISLDVAVFTTFYRDHMNYYKDSMEDYWNDKSAIFASQSEDDVLILSPQVAEIMEEKDISREYLLAKEFPKDWRLKLLGEHNRQNAALALYVARSLGISDEISRKVLENFNGVPGRLEYLGEKNGIKYFNDTTATSPEGVIAALHALSGYKSKIILMGGGADKSFEYTTYAEEIKKNVKALVLFKGGASDKVLALLSDSTIIAGKNITSMAEAFALAQSIAKTGDVIILSPGAASFGIFKNEYDRGDQFTRLFKLL